MNATILEPSTIGFGVDCNFNKSTVEIELIYTVETSYSFYESFKLMWVGSDFNEAVRQAKQFNGYLAVVTRWENGKRNEIVYENINQ